MIEFQVVQARNKEWFPRIRGGNREKWYKGETHKRKADAVRSLHRLFKEILGSMDEIMAKRPAEVPLPPPLRKG